MSPEIQAWYQEYQAKLQAEFNETRSQALAEQAARAVLTALRVRNLAVPEWARERILSQKNPEILERWHERAIVAASVAEVFDKPS